MSKDMTYEEAEYTLPLEHKEWVRTWWEEPYDTEHPRVWLIGDSIFFGVISQINRMAVGRVLYDGFCSSKGADNPYFLDELKLFAAQEGHRDVILFNNGLHGWHLEDATDYASACENLVRFLKESFPDAALILSLTTAVEGTHKDRVPVRNDIFRQIAAKFGCPVLDLYTVSLQHQDQRVADGVHYTESGYQILSRAIMQAAEEQFSLTTEDQQ